MTRAGRIELGALGVLTVAVYVALWSAQRALWTNGLGPGVDASYPRPGADVVAGGTQGAAVVVLGVAATGLFAWAVVRAPRLVGPRRAWPVLVVPVLVAIGLWAAPPTLSIDVYSYLSHGYLAATGHNPYTQASASVADTAYGRRLVLAGWQAVHPETPYGPLWTAIERLAFVLSGGDVAAGVRWVKLPVLVAVLGTAALIHRFLADASATRRVRGVLLFVANPLVLIELAGDGHNDGLMGCFLVLSIVAAARGRSFVAVLAIAFAVLVKLNAAPFALPIAVALVVLRRSGRGLAIGASAGVALASGLAMALIAPYWAGAGTFAGLLQSGTAGFGWSLSGLIRGLQVSPEAAFYDPAAAQSSAFVTSAVIGALLVLGTAAASSLATSVRGLAAACGIVSLLVLLVLPLEWPWYGALPAAVLPLTAGTVEVAVLLVIALGSRLVAPIGDAASLGVVETTLFTTVQAFVGQTIPAAVGLAATTAAAIARRRC